MDSDRGLKCGEVICVCEAEEEGWGSNRAETNQTAIDETWLSVFAAEREKAAEMYEESRKSKKRLWVKMFLSKYDDFYCKSLD